MKLNEFIIYDSYFEIPRASLNKIEDLESIGDVATLKIILENNVDDEIPDFHSQRLDWIIEKKPDVKILCVYKNYLNEVFSFDYRKTRIFLNMAQEMKKLSKCTRLQVCCLIIKNGRIISTGVNGSPKGFKNCSEVFTISERLKPDYSIRHHQFSDDYEIHAEMNAILELGKNTSIDSYDNLEMYCTTCPCPNCAKNIAQAGVKTIFFSDVYDRLPEGGKHLQEFKITVIKC